MKHPAAASVTLVFWECMRIIVVRTPDHLRRQANTASSGLLFTSSRRGSCSSRSESCSISGERTRILTTTDHSWHRYQVLSSRRPTLQLHSAACRA